MLYCLCYEAFYIKYNDCIIGCEAWDSPLGFITTWLPAPRDHMSEFQWLKEYANIVRSVF